MMMHFNQPKNWPVWIVAIRPTFKMGNVQKLCVWVPHILGENNKNQRVNTSTSLPAHRRLARQQHQLAKNGAFASTSRTERIEPP